MKAALPVRGPCSGRGVRGPSSPGPWSMRPTGPVAADDGTGPISFNLILFTLLAVVAVRRAVLAAPGWVVDLVPVLLLGVAAYASSA